MTNWYVTTAAKNLNITLVPFDENVEDPAEVRGYSHERAVAINPAIHEKVFVTFHEFAHVLLGHTETLAHNNYMASNLEVAISEVEAHSVALAVANKVLTPEVDYDPITEAQYLINASLTGSPAGAARYINANKDRLAKVADAIYNAGLRDSTLA